MANEQQDIEYFKGKLNNLQRKVDLLEDAAAIAVQAGNEHVKYYVDLNKLCADKATGAPCAPTQAPVTYKYVSTKEYHNAFPCAYRQWRADSHCNLIHGYAFSMKFYFGTNDLDARNWVADYGGLKELKKFLEDQFDHTLLCSKDDPELETFKMLASKRLAKLTILPKLGCEGLADMLYKYVNAVYIPEMWGPAEAQRLWCFRVEVRETVSNMAYREGHRQWGEDLFEGLE